MYRILGKLLKKPHMLRCARPISRQRTRRVRLRSSIFVRLTSEVFLSSLLATRLKTENDSDEIGFFKSML